MDLKELEIKALFVLGEDISNATDEDLIAIYRLVDKETKAASEAFGQTLMPFVKLMAFVQSELHKRLNERKATNTRTDAGLAYLHHAESITVVDRAAWFKFVHDNWEKAQAYLTAAISKDAVLADLRAQKKPDNVPDDQWAPTLPPGLKSEVFESVRIRKS